MSKVKYDGWCVKWSGDRRAVSYIYFTKKKLINAFNFDGQAPERWKSCTKQGLVKAVKVRIVEVNDGQ